MDSKPLHMSGDLDGAMAKAEEVLRRDPGNCLPGEASKQLFKGSLYVSAGRATNARMLGPNIEFDWSFDEKRSHDLMRRANAGDPAAKEVVREYVNEHIKQRKPLPESLGNYVRKNLDHKPKGGKPGKNPAKTFSRDRYIALAVSAVRDFGFERTRGEATANKYSDKHSACSIVATVLKEKFNIEISEESVKKAANKWKHYGG